MPPDAGRSSFVWRTTQFFVEDELPNPHRNCVREILNALICHDNDHRRLNIELRDLQNEFKQEMEKIEFRCAQLRKPIICPSSESVKNFEHHIADIDEVNECFTNRIDVLKKNRQEILETAKQCLIELKKEKCKFKQFHEKTIDHLKRFVIKSDDPKVIRNCEKDICEMNRLFVKEVAFIKNCESNLQPFFKELIGTDFLASCTCCCFKEYEWIPPGKSFSVIDDIANNIKNNMKSTLREAFAQLHVHQSPDPKSFLAAYLMNVQDNEELSKKKLHLFGNV